MSDAGSKRGHRSDNGQVGVDSFGNHNSATGRAASCLCSGWSGQGVGLEYRASKGDGTLAVISMDCKVAYNDDGTFRQAHCVIRDVTAERQLEQERMHFEAAARHRQKLESIGTLASGVAPRSTTHST